MDYGMPYLIDCGSPENCAALCRDLGLSFVELNVSFPDCTMQKLKATDLMKLSEMYGIYFTLHLDENFNPCAYDDEVRAAWQKHMLSAIALATACGMPSINMHWERGIYITLPDRRVFMNEVRSDDYLRNALLFRDLCSTAADGQVMLNIENTDGWLPWQQQAIETLLESGSFGLTLDIGHSHAVGDMDIPFYEKHIGRLHHMHAHDGLGLKPHLAFGDGEIDLTQRLGMARNAGAHVVLEVKTPDALRRTVELLPHYDPLYRKD